MPRKRIALSMLKGMENNSTLSGRKPKKPKPYRAARTVTARLAELKSEGAFGFTLAAAMMLPSSDTLN